MKKTTFSEMRRRAKFYFDAVENGETITVTRRGKAIAKIVPASHRETRSWQKPALRLSIPGAELSQMIRDDRRERNQ